MEGSKSNCRPTWVPKSNGLQPAIGAIRRSSKDPIFPLHNQSSFVPNKKTRPDQQDKSSKQPDKSSDLEKDKSSVILSSSPKNQDRPIKKSSGILVTPPFKPNEDGLISINVGETLTDTTLIENNGKQSQQLLSAKLIYAKPAKSFSLSRLKPPSGEKHCTNEALWGFRALQPDSSLEISLSCHGVRASMHKATLLLQFEESIDWCHVALMGEDTCSKNAAPTARYKGKLANGPPPAPEIVAGQRPPSLKFTKVLPQYAVPKILPISKTELTRAKQELSMSNYSKYFSTLLYMEELQMQKDIRIYDQKNVQMSAAHDGLLALKVSGLAEKRPSLVYQDAIYARESNTTDVEYQGIIYSVQGNEIHVKFGKQFHKKFVPNLRLDIRFSFSRINLRRAHHAVSQSEGLNRILFPNCTADEQCQNGQKDFTHFNPQLNEEQTIAVGNILNKSGGPPYIIFGPPGTGKTVTLVEAICQIHRSDPKAVILACAPSNGASDLILERLIGNIQERDMYRMNAYSRPRKDVPTHLRPYCSAQNSNFFTCPGLVELMKYKLIISTYMGSGLLDAQGVPSGHFSHIFLDEAGQATEPDSLVPIANLATSKTVIVLAGDPQQLGPVISSKNSDLAESPDLAESLLERLITSPLYDRVEHGHCKHITKLVKNYRSHPDILDLPSRLFYNGELKPCAGDRAYSLCDWDELPSKKVPLLFFGVEGSIKREGSSPSFFNPQEVSKVMQMVSKLRDAKNGRVRNNDIGIITPYSRQVKKIKNALAAAKLSDIKVGSVEQFQGQEKLVIIISTVRTSLEFVEFDKQHRIGFLADPKRFNVAITRAKALLIIIGNPYVLCKDKYWGHLITHYEAKKAYTGCSTPKKNEEELQIIQESLKELRIIQEASSSLQ